ncbi:tryparedoxin peroxidase [Trypanosoma vivax]|nr:tryparedoxin peroxidase [Trypanosoma vivax]
MFRRLAMTPLLSSVARRSFTTTLPLLNLDYQAYRAATVREPAPEWSGKAIVDGKIKEISSNDYKGKYVVLFFYPFDFTFVCPTEIITFSESYAEFEKHNTQVIAISCDSHFSHLAWVETPRKKGGLGEIKIPLLSDFTKEMARDYGVLVEEQGLPLRGLFVIDDKGILRHVTINDLPVGRNVEEVLRVVQAFQYADKNGDVIPCNWKPGKETINPDRAKEFFEKNN